MKVLYMRDGKKWKLPQNQDFLIPKFPMSEFYLVSMTASFGKSLPLTSILWNLSEN